MASPESRALRATFHKQDPDPSVPAAVGRAEWEAAVAAVALPAGVILTPLDVAGRAGAWVVADGATPDAALLFAHGGGYNAGSWRTHRELGARLSLAAGLPVLLFDYRLAPEEPFPAAVEDAVAAYRWLRAQGFVPGRVAIGGDSAGGGLAAALLLALRAAADPLPAAAVLLSPWLDLALSGPTLETKADVDPLTSRADLALAADWYVGAADPRSPLASPLYGELAWLPPLLIQVGGDEVLLSDATRFAARAEASGVAVTLEVWDEMWHVWQAFAAELPEGQQAIDRIGAWLRDRLGRSG